MRKKKSYDVFLSYSRKDQDWVKAFEESLSKSGVRAWFDASKIAPGERWQDHIQKALRDSRVLVVILTTHSMDSPWTFFEIGAAVADRKRIIPVVTEEVNFEQIPSLLRQLQFLRERSPSEAGKRVAAVIGESLF